MEEVCKPVSDEVETIPFHCMIINKNEVGAILSQLSKDLPLPDKFKHLKRINKDEHDGNLLHILLYEASPHEGVENANSALLLEDYVHYIVSVPLYPPTNSDQFRKARKLWPITYHPSTPPPPMTSEEELRFENAMRQAITLANHAGEEGNAPVGMVVLSAEGSTLVVSEDTRNTLFLDHCCMKGMQKQSDALQKKRNGKRPTKEDEYLCTDCDVVITREPCMMCCMCLLHSRVKRIIYGCDDDNGGLYSKWRLQQMPQVNHHFRVYRGLLREECQDVWDAYARNKQYIV